ncbi:uncharacterized protein LOC122019358 [Zingiber officinale]|uniref:uncharacterized protein LOC122019358 n=1 Tax=Zingiber officinale TaxID=94328 RepID=UPI001C4A927E|nr:uncharacterized protein LOC122019358 [Zingiber officinale]
MAESSLPKDLKKGKAIALRQDPRVEPEEQVPFSTRILKEKLPKGYKPPAIEKYDGSQDLEDHLHKFRNATLLHQYIDAIKCRVFLNTLSGSTQKWFDGLPNGSITCFHDFKTIFLRHFTSSRKYQKMDHCLFALKQGPTELLRSYIRHFNQIAQDVPSATSEILMSVFSHGLVEGEFFRDLIQDPVKNFDEMPGRAFSYINVEESQAAWQKADKAPASTNKLEKRSPKPPTQPLPRVRVSDRTFHPVRIPGRPNSWLSSMHRGLVTGALVTFARDSRRVAELGLPPPELAPKLQRLVDSQQVAVGLAGKPWPDNAGQGSK